MPRSTAHTAAQAPEDADTKTAILEAGVACIARYGNEKTSVQDVADEARVSRGTVYRYFEDRATLFAAISRYEGERMEAAVRARTADLAGFEECVAVVVEEWTAGALRYHTRDHLRRHDRGFADLFMFGRRRQLESMRALIEPIVRRAKSSGHLADGVTVRAAVDWVAICLSTVVPLPEATSFDVNDPVATGRFYARSICRGIAR